jgi:hypothetical protein
MVNDYLLIIVDKHSIVGKGSPKSVVEKPFGKKVMLPEPIVIKPFTNVRNRLEQRTLTQYS